MDEGTGDPKAPERLTNASEALELLPTLILLLEGD
jgi:hypothetical protein